MVFVTQFCLSLDLCRVWLRTGDQLPRLARLADIRRARSRAICFYHTTSPARLIRWGGQQRRITQIQEISKSVPAWYKTTKICNHSSHPLIRSFIEAWIGKKKKAKWETWQKLHFVFSVLSRSYFKFDFKNQVLRLVYHTPVYLGGWILFIYLQMLPARPGAQRDGRGVVWETQRCWHWSWGGNPIIASKRHLAVLNQNAGESFLFRAREQKFCLNARSEDIVRGGCGGWRRDQVSPSVTQDSFCSYCTLARELYLLHHWQL